MKEPLYIVFDGIDGCGKDTQIELVQDWLLAEGYSQTIVTREPGGSSMGASIRGLLNKEMSGLEELFLFSADRAAHMREIVFPALDNSNIILQSRGMSATFAIQGQARGVDIDDINRINYISCRGFLPDHFIIYDLNPKIARSRLVEAPDRKDPIEKFDNYDMQFHEKVRSGYYEFHNQHQDLCTFVNADRTVEDVFRSTLKIVTHLLSRKGITPGAV